MLRRNHARLVLLAATTLLVSLAPAAPPWGYSPVSRNSYDALDSSVVPKSADNGRRTELNDSSKPRNRLGEGKPAIPGRPNPRTQQVRTNGKSLGIPVRILQAYQGGAIRLRFADPGCKLDWPILAGIGKVESNHAWDGRVDERGTTLQPILGPVLDGTRYAAIPDTDGGRLDENRQWDRAVGPMQFIPRSWERFAADGNGDGVMSPHNIYDAVYATAMYLCVGDTDLSQPDSLSRAIHRYNHSAPYVEAVTAWIEAYRKGGARPEQGSTGPVVVADDSPGPSSPKPGTPRPGPTPRPSPLPTEPGPEPAPRPTPSNPGPTPPGPSPAPTTTPTPSPTPTPTPGPWCPLESVPLPLPPVCL